eukprot:gnl/MRDRNA2_/MRDRNA2_94517_c0_seq1.p1 gnl/MRDRNA2_/MRDRNA2_94517_c0~~gnl/MRDRNA2_/MRDRNA2_94517_c0_seq1.p1  ORF type:complete len:1036 (-),score=243.87 gnl/MRDRNA2_/MRDRNA2_94517_c0_seq1:151-3258(-)
MPFGSAAKQVSMPSNAMLGDRALLKENVPSEILESLRSKEETVRSLQHALEGERKKRRQLQADAATERAAARDHFDRTESDLRRRIEAAETDCARRLDESKSQRERLHEQLELARGREADLLAKNDALSTDLKALVERAEAEDADGLALRARAAAVGGDLAEAQQALRTADEVQEEMRRQLEQRDAEITTLRNQLQEVHQIERSTRETGAAQFERMTFQCETLTRQVHEKTRESDLFSEKSQRLETELKKSQVELENEIQAAATRAAEAVASLEKSRAEVRALQTEIMDKTALDSKRQETIATMEMELEKRKAQEQQLRKELFQSRSETQEAAGERDVAREAGRKREAHLNKSIAEIEDKLGKAEAQLESRLVELYSTRSQLRTTELELQNAQETIASLRKEVTSVREAETSMRLNSVKQLEETLQKRDADVVQLQKELSSQKEACAVLQSQLSARDGELHHVKGDLAGRTKELQEKSVELDASQEELAQSKANKESLVASHSLQISELTEELERTRDEFAERSAMWENTRTALVAEKEVMTSPRLLSQDRDGVRGREWDSEIDGLYRQLSSLRAAVGDQQAAPQSRRASVAASAIDSDDSVEDFQPMLKRKSSLIGQEAAAGEPLNQAPTKRSSFSSAPGRRSSDYLSNLSSSPIRKSSFVAAGSSPRDPKERPVDRDSFVTPGAMSEGQGWGEIDIDRVRAGTLRYFARRVTMLQNKGLLWDTWLLWTSMHHLVMRSRLEASAADEVQFQTECAAREAGLQDLLKSRHISEGSMRVVKGLLLEFRHRLASAICEALPQVDTDLETRRKALVRLLDIGRSSFGRALNAAVFLYQKLRTLVPSELFEEIEDPLGGVVPLPFYVKSYKVKHALKRMTQPRGSSQGEGVTPRKAGLASRIEELEERMPLNARSFFEIPHFIADLAEVRAQASSTRGLEEADLAQSLPQLRDRLDVLLVDSLTIYMSAWKLIPAQVGPLDSGWSSRVIERRSSSPAAAIALRSIQARGSRGAGVALGGHDPDRSYSPRLRLGRRPTVP